VNVLILGPSHVPLLPALHDFGDTASSLESPLNHVPDAEFIVSYGYRHIIPEHVLLRYGRRAVNLHISLLPWNRGADPNLWSFLEGTPKGVSIHQIDAGIDTGPVLAQEDVTFGDGETLRTTYVTLQQRLQDLFLRIWPALRTEAIAPRIQVGKGTFHRAGDRHRFRDLLPKGWDTPVSEIEDYGIRHGLRLTPLRNP
jgi:methionyl-tRNA formyltransferase